MYLSKLKADGFTILFILQMTPMNKGWSKNWKAFSCCSAGVLFRPLADKFWNVKNVTLNGYDIFSGIDAHRYNLPQGSSQSCYTRGIHPGRRWISHRSGISDFLGLRHRKSSISSTVSLSLSHLSLSKAGLVKGGGGSGSTWHPQSYHSIKLLTFNRCRQTPPRPSIADPQPICHFDPLLGGFLYLAWFFDSCILLRDIVPNVKRQYVLEV